MHQKCTKILKTPNVRIFFLKLKCMLIYKNFYDFVLTKRCNVYPRPMLPPNVNVIKNTVVNYLGNFNPINSRVKILR